MNLSCQQKSNQEPNSISLQEIELVKRLKNPDPSALDVYLQTNPTLLENLSGNFIPLHLAAYFGNVEIMKSLLKQGAQIDRVNCDGNTALHFAAFALQTQSVDYLLANGANPKVANTSGDTPLHFVSGAPVEWLFGSMFSSKPLSLVILPESLRSELQLKPSSARSSLANFKQSQKQIITTFLSKGIPVDVKNLQGRTPLFYAAMSKEVDVFRQINLADGYILVKDNIGSNLLHQLALGPLPLEAMLNPPSEKKQWQDAATYHSTTEREQPLLNLIKQMIQLGVPFDEADQQNSRPIHAAAKTGQENILNLLLTAGAKVNAPEDQVDPLALASSIGDLTSVKLLVNAGAQLNLVLRNRHALAEAATYGQESVVNYLIDRGYQIEAGGISALTAAVEGNQEKMVKALLQRKAQINFVDISNRSPLIAAFQTRNVEMVKLLLASGANLREMDDMGNTPLYHLGKKNSPGLPFFDFPSLEPQEKKIDALTFLKNLSLNLDFQHQNNEGNSLLHQWILDNQTVLITSSGALTRESVNLPNSQGNTALHLAVEQKNPELVKALIAQGADINLANTQGQTALDFAIRLGQIEIAHILASMPNQSLHFNRHVPAYLQALWNLQIASLEMLVKQPDWNPAYKDGQGKTILSYVLTHDRSNSDNLYLLLKGLLDAGVSPNQLLSPVGQTPLAWLAKNRFSQAVQLFLDKGADPNLMTTQNDESATRGTPIHEAARNKDQEMCQNLLKYKANPSLHDGLGYTALHYFAQNGQLDLLKLAQEQGWQMDVSDWQGRGLMYWALENNKYSVLFWLLDKMPQTQILTDLDKTLKISLLQKDILEKNEFTKSYVQKKLGGK
ncbi:MAG: ankyrin repeat domain-containing protein [Candidatus Sericytochromatia bacterium]